MSHSPNLSPQISNDIIDADTTSLASTETQQNIQHSQIHPIGHHGREQLKEPQNTTKQPPPPPTKSTQPHLW